MTHASVDQVLKGQYKVDDTVTVKGWVRTRRDSKAGFSFVALHDGSCFDPIQIVADNNLSNYEEIKTPNNRLLAYCYRKTGFI